MQRSQHHFLGTAQPLTLPLAISVKNVTKTYRLYKKHSDRVKETFSPFRKKYHHPFYALREISFDVQKGQSVGIIGLNGSGKSTLLQIVCGILQPTSGSVTVNGRISALLELGAGFNPEFTGRQNVFLNGSILGIHADEMRERFDEIASFADIGEFIDQPVKIYSSGMYVRLAFAVAVSVDPEILVVDEALAVGDAGFQFKCMDRLETLRQRGVTILLVSHDIGLIKNYCEMCLYLDQGRLKASGSANEMAEFYYLDNRRKQTGQRDAPKIVRPKKNIGNTETIAFGTDQGEILDAWFTEPGVRNSTVSTGERLEFTVMFSCSPDLTTPAISFGLHDLRGFMISGFRYLIEEPAAQNSVRFSFSVNLASGHYFLNPLLEDYRSDGLWTPVDKQVGLLQLEVLPEMPKRFLGTVDLNVACEIIENEDTDEHRLSG